MPYNEKLLERIRRILADVNGVTEKRMFGSVAFMVRGNMACGPHGDSLIVRIGNDAAAGAMKEPHVRPMDFTGRVLRSFAYVDPQGIAAEAQLRRWVTLAADYAASLPRPASRKRPAKNKAPPAGRRRKP